ncbi:MAG: c-type cytochrome domain-containing protein [Bacteroidota bacterium]
MKIYLGRILSLILLSVVAVAGCELVTPPSALDYTQIQTADISYVNHIQPIFDRYCTRCHAGTDAAEGLRLDSWENLVAGGNNGSALIAFDGDNSLMINMVTKLVGGPHPFELSADTLGQGEITFLKRWIDGGALFDDGSVPYGDASELLYVPNQNDALISIIDTESQTVIRNVDLVELNSDLFTPNAKPHHVAVDPTGDTWYVSLIGDNKVCEFSNGSQNRPLFEGCVDFETPGILAVNGVKDEVYAGRSLTAVTPPQSIAAITQLDRSVREIDVFFSRPHALAVDPSGEFVHTGSLNENRVMTVNTSTDEVTFTLLAAPFHSFVQFAISPDGSRMVATGQSSNQVVILDSASPPGIIRIGAIEVDNQPWHPVWTPDGSQVYVGNLNSNSVSVLDMNNFTILQTITGDGLSQPHGASITPDGDYVYISNRNMAGGFTPRYDFGTNQDKGTVVVINTATNTIEKVIEVGRFPAGLSAIVP